MAPRPRRHNGRGTWDALPTLYIRPAIREVLEPLILSLLEQPVQRGRIMERVSILDDDAFDAVSYLVSYLRSLRKAGQRRSQGAVYDLGCVAGMLAVLHVARRLQERLPGTQDVLESMNRVKAHTERNAKERLSARNRPAGELGRERKRENTAERNQDLIKDALDLRRHLIKAARPGEPAPSAWDVAGRLQEARKRAGLPNLSHRRIYELIRPALRS